MLSETTLEQIVDMKVIYVRFITGNIQDCVPEWRISKSDFERARSHSHIVTRLEGPLIHQKLLKVAVLYRILVNLVPLAYQSRIWLNLGRSVQPKGQLQWCICTHLTWNFCNGPIKLPSCPLYAPRSCRKDSVLLREYRKPERYQLALQNASHNNV